MNPVFDINELPNRRLMVRQMVALHPHMDIGEAVHCIRRDMVMKLAHTSLRRTTSFTRLVLPAQESAMSSTALTA